MNRCGEAGPGPAGTVMSGTFQLEGQEFMALNGGPQFKFTPAISLFVNCETQPEVDELWEKLSAGGQKERCGWLTDKYGLSWQIIPTTLGKMLADKNPEKSKRVMQAMLQMQKIDIDGLKRASEQKWGYQSHGPADTNDRVAILALALRYAGGACGVSRGHTAYDQRLSSPRDPDGQWRFLGGSGIAAQAGYLRVLFRSSPDHDRVGGIVSGPRQQGPGDTAHGIHSRVHSRDRIGIAAGMARGALSLQHGNHPGCHGRTSPRSRWSRARYCHSCLDHHLFPREYEGPHEPADRDSRRPCSLAGCASNRRPDDCPRNDLCVPRKSPGSLCHRRDAEADARRDYARRAGASGDGVAAVVHRLERETPTGCSPPSDGRLLGGGRNRCRGECLRLEPAATPACSGCPFGPGCSIAGGCRWSGSCRRHPRSDGQRYPSQLVVMPPVDGGGNPSALPSGRENEIQCGKAHRRNALELGTPSCAVIFCLHVRTASDGDRGCGSAPGPMAPVQNPGADGRFW